MRRLYTVAFPEVPLAAERFMRDFRQAHHRAAQAVVEPHFTLVFGCDQIAQVAYTDHVAAIAGNSEAIAFTCKYAMLGAGDEDGTACVFLVPDDGYAAISLLHDRLYSGALEPHLRLDLPFVPHVTIGSTTDRRHAKSLCDGLNQSGVAVEGVISALTVGVVEDGRFVALSTHAMRRHAADRAAP